MDGRAPADAGWAVPPRAAVADLLWLSYGAWTASGSARAAGVLATVTWVRGGRAAPVTGRVDAPVSRVAAEAEYWAAVAEECDGPEHPAGVGRTDAGDGGWVRGVMETLRWLLGVPGRDGPAPPPMPVPVRRPDGSIPTPREVYDRAFAARPGWAPLPPERRDLWQGCEVEVARSHRLDEEIRRIQRELVAGGGADPRRACQRRDGQGSRLRTSAPRS